MQRISEEDLDLVLAHTKPLWAKVANKTIFLTGGTGFFGKWLAESFVYINEQLDLNAQLIVLSRSPETFLSTFPFYKKFKSVTFIKGDITNFELPKNKIDYIIHAATEASADLIQNKPLLMLDTITLGTRRVLELAKMHTLEAFLFTSSGAVYGKQPEHVSHIKESDSFHIDINNPGSSYAEGKRLAELYCSTFYKQYQVPVKIARCFAFVGPYLPLDKHFAIGNFILNAINNEDILIKGDGTPFRSYLYAADLAIWLWTTLLKGKVNTAYNIGSDEDYQLKRIAELVQTTNCNINVIVQGNRVPEKAIERYVPNVDLAKADLGLNLYTSLADSINKTKMFYGGQ